MKYDEPEVENVARERRTNDRASSVLSYDQPLAYNCLSSSETVGKRRVSIVCRLKMHAGLITVRGYRGGDYRGDGGTRPPQHFGWGTQT